MRASLSPTRRAPVLWLTAILTVVVFAGGYLVVSARAAAPAASTAAASSGPAVMVVDQVDGRSDVVVVDPTDPGAARRSTGLRCQRVYAAAGITSCMRLSGLGPSYELVVTDAAGAVLRTVGLPGIPSRTRVSASGRIVTWTVFVTGDSYAAPGGFSTRTGFLDLRDGRLVESLEGFTAQLGGQPHTAADTNYWGMTVGSDDRTFYATMATGDHHFLVRGDLGAGTLAEVREGAECPSLSPDGTRVAYKKRTGRLGGWELAVLDLATGAETLLDGTQGVDDQAAWLDDAELAYGVPADSGTPPAVYRTAADGRSKPVLLASGASSPVPMSPATGRP